MPSSTPTPSYKSSKESAFTDRIYLTWQYGKGILLIGAVYNLLCALLLAQSVSYMLFVDVFIIKMALVAVVLYLIEQFRDRDSIYFYVNLGLSRKKMLISIILADFLSFFILLTIILLIYG